MSDSVNVKNSTVPAMAALHSYPDYHALQEDIEADHVFPKISSSYNMAGRQGCTAHLALPACF